MGYRISKYRSFRTNMQIYRPLEAVLNFCLTATVREKCPYIIEVEKLDLFRPKIILRGIML